MVLMQRDIKATYFVAINWRTFSLTDKPLEDIPKRVLKKLNKAEIANEKFFLMRQGKLILDLL